MDATLSWKSLLEKVEIDLILQGNTDESPAWKKHPGKFGVKEHVPTSVLLSLRQEWQPRSKFVGLGSQITWSAFAAVISPLQNKGGTMQAGLLACQQSKSAALFLRYWGSSAHKRQLAASSARLPAGR
jgi:hypothetical protein